MSDHTRDNGYVNLRVQVGEIETLVNGISQRQAKFEETLESVQRDIQGIRTSQLALSRTDENLDAQFKRLEDTRKYIVRWALGIVAGGLTVYFSSLLIGKLT